MKYAYSPDTGEFINVPAPAAWMLTTTIAPPVYDPQMSGCFFRNGAWVIVTADQLTPAKAAQIAAIDAAYSAAIQLPVAYMATTFQADTGSQDILVKSLSGGATYAPNFWLDTNNVQISMTFAQLQGLSGAMIQQGQTAFLHRYILKSAVRAATTIAAVQAAIW